MNSGKDTVAEYLVQNFYFRRESFAGVLKDVVASVFGWDRDMLEGLTVESREQRNQVDQWWADRLDIADLTPRLMLQRWGTDVCRNAFHNHIWIASLENRLRHSPDNHIVISDCRFPDEMTAIRNFGGKIIRIQRGTDPDWMPIAGMANCGDSDALAAMKMSGIHESEWAWIGHDIDMTVCNDGTIADLHTAVLACGELTRPEQQPDENASHQAESSPVSMRGWRNGRIITH
jgi:hypothetical protein